MEMAGITRLVYLHCTSGTELHLCVELLLRLAVTSVFESRPPHGSLFHLAVFFGLSVSVVNKTLNGSIQEGP